MRRGSSRCFKPAFPGLRMIPSILNCCVSLHPVVVSVYIFPMINGTICLFATLFGEVSFQIFCQFLVVLFVFLWLSYEGSLYILDKIPSSNMYFEKNTFSQSVALLLIFLTASFKEQKFCVLMKSDSSVFLSIDLAFGVISKNVLSSNTLEV